MNIIELMELKNKIQKEYDQEKEKYDSALDETDKEVFKKELNMIAKELSKIEDLTKISEIKDINYRILKLERLYMMIMSGFSASDFNELNEDKKFEIFDKYFPNEWVYNFPEEKKEQLLLDAICGNKIIILQEVKKLQKSVGE